MTLSYQVDLRRVISVFTCAAIIASVLAGCRDSDPGFEVITLEGKVEKLKIEADGTGEITVLYFSEKHNQEMLGTGTITKETEIMISGVLARLEDIRLGEHVRGEVRIQKKREKQERIALKIYIDRAQPVTGSGG